MTDARTTRKRQVMHAELSRDPALRAPGDRAQDALRLAVGDLVVYASHGIGRVESREHHRDGGEMLVLVFESGLKVTLPLDRARNTLRSLSGEAELEEVERTLGSASPPAPEHWSRRHRNSQAKLVGGTVGGLAEIVRDGAHRERQRVKGGTAPIRNQLYRAARKLLVAEVAAARGIEPDVADAWIVQRIEGDPLTTRRARRAPGAESGVIAESGPHQD
jgi:RNA polymerase-interacting CarD/CdnL/TRCF family regulator